MPEIQPMRTPEEFRQCYPVMVQLRPHLTETDFVDRVLRQFAGQSYHLVAVLLEGAVTAVAGYRFVENLFSGKLLYVDDLVADEHHRSQGHGGMLMDWLIAEAKSGGCNALELDSGVQRFAAHRFYLAKRMNITSHHFSLSLPD